MPISLHHETADKPIHEKQPTIFKPKSNLAVFACVVASSEFVYSPASKAGFIFGLGPEVYLVERIICNDEAGGSTPPGSTALAEFTKLSAVYVA